MADVFDLFGNPSRERKGERGRPAYEATSKDRNKVKMLLALGWSIKRIANAIAISPATLKRYFRAELKARDAMRDRLEARRFELVWTMAEAGNVGAMREFARLVERNDLMVIERELAEHPPEPKPKERIGKKALEAQRALEADANLMAELEQEASEHGRH